MTVRNNLPRILPSGQRVRSPLWSGSTRMFDGKKYRFANWYTNEKNAKVAARQLRSYGRLARVTPIVGGWALWEHASL